MKLIAAAVAVVCLTSGCVPSPDAQQSSDYGRYVEYCHKLGGWMTMLHGATWTKNAEFQCFGPKGPLMPEITFG